jgi:lipopolysaccharide transport system ATP-binding protein
LCTRGIILENGKVVFEGDVNEAINGYLSNNKKLLTETSLLINESHRRYKLSLEIEILSLSFINQLYDNCFASSEPIKILATLKCNQSINNYRIAGSIFSDEDIKIGTFFTNTFQNISEGKTIAVEIVVNSHNLAKGKYFFALSVGNGNEETGNVEYDIVYDVLGFEITHKKDLKSPIIKWPNDWGNISFQSKLILKNES